MKTLKVEAVYPMAFETFEEITEHLPHFIEEVYNKRRLHSALGYWSHQQFDDQHIRRSRPQVEARGLRKCAFRWPAIRTGSRTSAAGSCLTASIVRPPASTR
ncbi:IS3 family transposase [Sinorhizobium meliloti]|uniref:IS3 family transposase n=1 Tax=Rhizobium meliloti TaxID=382 RepID=UPI00338DF62C